MTTSAAHEAAGLSDGSSEPGAHVAGLQFLKAVHAGGRIATAEGRTWEEAGTFIARGHADWLVMMAPGAPA
jgi:hypothetical protein